MVSTVHKIKATALLLTVLLLTVLLRVQRDNNSKASKPDSTPGNRQKRAGIISTIFSVMAAFFGVQSNKNRLQDFENGSAVQFIIIGLIAVILFVLSLVWIVSIVLQH